MSHPLGLHGIRLGIARGISFGLFGATHDFVTPSRALGAGLVRVYVYWSQVEPEPGRFDWKVVDAILQQLTGDEEVWVTVCSSSQWATEVHSDFLPPSPALDTARYERFAAALVARCRGKVQYWQCNNEPSNQDLLWAGTAAQYVTQLKALHRAVRAADPSAAVVLGGCGYDMLSSAPGSPQRQFFEHLVEHGRDAFDVFAVNLYAAPEAIPENVQAVRSLMQAHGYERPVVVGEYNGPTFFEFPELESILQQAMTAAFADGQTSERSTQTLGAEADTETPERRAMKALYARMAELPPQLQMFMVGCPPELEERRHRINCREIVARNLFALSVGVRRTVCWDLAPEVPNYEDPYTFMELMNGKLPLLGYVEGRLERRHPSALTFQLLAAQLRDAVAVRRMSANGRPEIFAFAVERPARGELFVFWSQGDVFAGEASPARPLAWPWTHRDAYAVDALGLARVLEPRHGSLQIPVSITPLFVSARAYTDI